MNPRAACIVLMLLLLGIVPAALQARPDFAGTWKLVEYRIGDKVTPTQNGLVGGAAVNCGLHCTITQTADTLTLSRTPAKDGTKPRDEVVFLDGRPATNVTTVTWKGATLTLVRTFASIVVTQTISLDGDRLVFSASVGGAAGPYVLTYERATAP